jgi:hypothetical protein
MTWKEACQKASAMQLQHTECLPSFDAALLLAAVATMISSWWMFTAVYPIQLSRHLAVAPYSLPMDAWDSVPLLLDGCMTP